MESYFTSQVDRTTSSGISCVMCYVENGEKLREASWGAP